jgi:DNA (cytosine-5)-methyltransferase 1
MTSNSPKLTQPPRPLTLTTTDLTQTRRHRHHFVGNGQRCETSTGEPSFGGRCALPREHSAHYQTPRKIVDLYCGAGGAAMGLHRAWPDAEIIGVDIRPQPRYPFRLVQASVFDLAWNWSIFDFIWASPPCQRYTQMLNHGLTDRANHPDHVAETRRRLQQARAPYVIENVPHAPLINPIVLCGEMFGLRVTRHRLFEASFPLPQPEHLAHRGTHIRKQGDELSGGYYYRVYGHETGKASWGAAMGIDWMRAPELAQAVPPAYSEWIARRYMERL